MAVCYCTKAECQALAARLAIVEGKLNQLVARFNQHVREPIPTAHAYNPPKPPNDEDYCTIRECNRILRIATDAKRIAIGVDSDLKAHKVDAIPKAHRYKPSVSVQISGAFGSGFLKLFSRVDVDGSSGNSTAFLPFNLPAPTSPPIIKLPDFNLPKLPDFNLPKLPDFNLPKLPDIKLPNINAPKINITPVGVGIGVNVSPTINFSPRGIGGGGAEPKPIACKLSARFNKSTCVLSITLAVNECTQTVNVNMQCEDLKPFLRNIQSDLKFVKNQFDFKDVIRLGKSIEPEEEGDWYGYEKEYQVLPGNLSEALGLISDQLERNHQDTVKAILPKGELAELPTPVYCEIDDEGNLQLGKLTTVEMGFGSVIPWIGRQVVLPYLSC
jgi:hypothetical protein